MIKPFETSRLLLRPLETSDAERMYLLDSNPEVMKYVGQNVLTQPRDSLKVIEMIKAQYEEFGIGRYAVVEKESNLLIGWSGLKFNTNLVNNYQDFYELGYRFLPEFWGKGYATESGKAFIEKGFEELNLNQIFAYAHSENVASNHTLKKLGFTQKNEFEEPDGICYWYEINKKEI